MTISSSVVSAWMRSSVVQAKCKVKCKSNRTQNTTKWPPAGRRERGCIRNGLLHTSDQQSMQSIKNTVFYSSMQYETYFCSMPGWAAFQFWEVKINNSWINAYMTIGRNLIRRCFVTLTLLRRKCNASRISDALMQRFHGYSCVNETASLFIKLADWWYLCLS